MKAYPTLYRGIQFRSRLEARWACWFDLKGETRWDYEPFDLEGYIPDFAIFMGEAEPMLGEVKPVYSLDAFLIYGGMKAGLALEKSAVLTQEFKNFIVLGATPNHAWCWHSQGGTWETMPPMTTELRQGWVEAGNAVQWKAPR